MKILFMGTPDFAVASLRALIDSPYEVIGAVTQTDKVQGRGYKLVPPPVKVCAAEHGIPVFQPKTLRGDEFVSLLAELDPDMIVVAAFGKILPHNVLTYPKYGCVNVHGSLLPEYRGAAPMQRAVIDGRKITGITTMLMDDGIDTGDMFLRRPCEIGPEDDFEAVHDRLAALGAGVLLETIAGILDGTLKPVPQSQSPDDPAPSYARKIEKEDCVIDFARPAAVLHDLVRGLSPAPLALTHTPDGKLLKVVRARLLPDGEAAQPGTVVSADNEGFAAACGPEGRGRLLITAVLPEGKGRMSAADFVRGRRIRTGDVLR